MRIEIPENVGLQKLHTEACSVSERRVVYAALGVSDCDPKLVMQAILAAQKLPVSGLVQDYIRHFEILFWYEHVQKMSSPDLIGLDQNRIGRTAKKLFFRSTEPYDAVNLLSTSSISEVTGYGFINDLYSSSSVGASSRNKDKFLEWLNDVACVRKHSELLDETDKSIHPWLKITARDNPPKFLGALRAHWKSSHRQTCSSFESSASIQKQLRKIIVQCCNGQECKLFDTILSTSEAISRSRRFEVENHLLFLSLLSDAWDNDDPDWRFLQQFEVICDTGLAIHFKALEALRLLQLAKYRGPDALVNIYQSLAGVAIMSDSNELKVMLSSFSSTSVVLMLGRRIPRLVDLFVSLRLGRSGTRRTTVSDSVSSCSERNPLSATLTNFFRRLRSFLLIFSECAMSTAMIFWMTLLSSATLTQCQNA